MCLLLYCTFCYAQLLQHLYALLSSQIVYAELFYALFLWQINDDGDDDDDDDDGISEYSWNRWPKR